jgi:hypothetical protein
LNGNVIHSYLQENIGNKSSHSSKTGWPENGMVLT